MALPNIFTEDDIEWVAPNFEPLPNGRLRNAYALDQYFTIQAGETIRTMQIDHFSGHQYSDAEVYGAVMRMLRESIKQGLAPVAWLVWEEPFFSIAIPDQFCIGPICWVPPGAGTTIQLGWRYRICFVMRLLTIQAVPALMPFALLAPLIIAAAFVLAGVGLVMVLKLVTGELKFEQVSGFTKEMLRAPGENVSTALTGPLMAMAGVMIAGGIFLPMFVARVEASVPIPGGGTVGGSVGSGGGGAAPAAPRRRR